jgi:hypothetical protein
MDKWIEWACYLLLGVMTIALWTDGSLISRLQSRAREGVHTEVLIDRLEVGIEYPGQS